MTDPVLIVLLLQSHQIDELTRRVLQLESETKQHNLTLYGSAGVPRDGLWAAKWAARELQTEAGEVER